MKIRSWNTCRRWFCRSLKKMKTLVGLYLSRLVKWLLHCWTGWKKQSNWISWIHTTWLARMLRHRKQACWPIHVNTAPSRLVILTLFSVSEVLLSLAKWTEIDFTLIVSLSISAEYLQKIDFLISQCSVAPCLRWGGYCHVGFIANFLRFPAVQTIWKSVKIWQSNREFKGRNFFET